MRTSTTLNYAEAGELNFHVYICTVVRILKFILLGLFLPVPVISFSLSSHLHLGALIVIVDNPTFGPFDLLRLIPLPVHLIPKCGGKLTGQVLSTGLERLLHSFGNIAHR